MQLYSGRLLDFKNVKSVAKALGKNQERQFIFLSKGRSK